MEDVLDLYEEPYDPKRPVVCFDEMPYQMVAETRTPVPAKPGRVVRYDYEYERRGMVNIFAFFEPKARWRHLDATERRTAVDFAQAIRRLADEHYPEAEKVRWCSTTSTLILPPRSTRHSSQRRRGASCVGWSSTTLPSTLPGSTRGRSNSRYSAGSASELPHSGLEHAKEWEYSMAARAKQTGDDGFVAFQRSRCSGEAEATLPTTTIVADY
jgi:DDE superfamily endonuclease